MTTQSYICLQTVDGRTVIVEPEIAELSPQLCLQLQSGVGYTKSNPICVPPQVKPDILASTFDYCRFHQAPGRTDKECNLFDDKFLRKDLETLSQLGHASHYLQLELLSDKLSKAIALSISNGSPDEKRKFLNYAIEHAKPEKLEEYINSFGGSRGRLLKKLSAKKKKELEELGNTKKVEASVESQKREDTNSVDDLVSFIDGGDGDSKKEQTKKKKNHRKKKGQNVIPSVCPTAEPSSSIPDGSLPLEDEFDEDEYDPAWKEKIDREVEEFARRLNVPNYR
ncbi:Ubiquitin-protein ligase, ASK21 [Heracleum sosnowskyi]|uniref:Ubiquitin-protein ligase, ASK21 n=1 Tax=Heracleum sosnowskyi TaxID=360622 RepID=A0AAD8HUT8_9APIA|nr:Ubiquitin-protein ligase, ASK21 [Heracleum sosnowskyi]